jgi:5-methylcytosine-specific restriction endonuclease McrA
MPYKDPEKQKKYQRDWIARRKLAWLEENGPCAKCGSEKDLQVDHIDPSTKTTHRIWSFSKEKRETELAKCQVLCFECHKNKTCNDNYGHDVKQHGTGGPYKDGCRCNLCVKGQNRRSRERFERRGKIWW